MLRTKSFAFKSFVVALLVPAHAFAAGLFLAPRGVRPLSRGGSFVAGADDVNALTYNPAGLADAEDNVMVDLALPVYNSTYTRSVYGDGSYEAPVAGQGLGLPSPTLGVVHDVPFVPGLRVGLGVAADYPLMQNWPDAAANPLAQQRYAIGNFQGTAMTKLSAGAGYRVTEYLSVGGALQLLIGNFASVSTISTCDGTLCTQPENPAYDATIQMRATGLAIPGANLGVQLRPTDWLRFGASWETGYTIDSTATFSIRMPSAPAYAAAELDPQNPQGRVVMRLPQQFRAGVELRPASDARIEAAAVYEPWSVHNRIDVAIDNASMRNLFALNTYGLAPMSLDRGFRDTWSLRLGGEYAPPLGDNRPIALRAGVMYEPSAVPVNMMTPMSVDLNKVLVGTGVQYSWDNIHIEATYAHVFMVDRSVTQGSVLQTNPTRPGWDGRTPIGNGVYQGTANLFGMGMRVDI